MSADLKAERWQRLKQLFDETVGLDIEGRSSYLDCACAGDAALRGEVESLLSSNSQAGSDSLQTAPLEGGPGIKAIQTRIGTRVGVYQLVKEVGRGGMGDVYRAVRVDGHFDKEVAVKLVRGGTDSGFVLERFRIERQILAGLDHPNIARLLDGGTTDDGLPYLVMELVAGIPIDQYCDTNRLNISQRLQLFRQVCAAMQYAHQRLVVHRDIKPSNILVSEDGTPKLLDFGIAKLLDPAGATQTTALQAMTPEYASPEQIRGQTITTASDVYSLGVLLYQLLTGRSPHAGDTHSPHGLARAICEKEPQLPSARVLVAEEVEGGYTRVTPEAVSGSREGTPAKLQRRLAGDLDNIVLKALRKEPDRRYASVEQFGEDLRRHLEGRPVSARADSWTYRAGKFVQRHRAAVAASAAAGIILVGGIVANVREGRIAKANGERAERRFNDVRQLANSFLFEFHDAIQHLPGATPARELVVKRALEYLDSLVKEAGNDPTLQRELATAYDKVANVQGAPYRDNLGNYGGALASYRKALAIREQLRQGSKPDEKLQSEIGRDYGEIGDLLKVTGDLSAALASYEKALVILRAIPNPSHETQREIALVQTRYSTALTESGEMAKAVENQQSAIAVTDKLILANPSDRELGRDKAIQTMRLGDAYQAMGRLPEALAKEREAVALFEALAVKTNAQSLRDVGVVYEHLAMVMQKMGDKRGAIEIELKAVAGDEEAAKADPSNALLRRDVYVGLYRLSTMQSDLGDLRAAMTNLRRALSLCERESVTNPASAEIRGDLGVFNFHLAEMLEKGGDKRGALQFYQKALGIEQAMSDSNPKDLVKRGDVSEDWMKVADLELAIGDRARALAGYRKALAIRESLVEAEPDDADGRSQLALIHQKLGAFYALQATRQSAGQSAANWREAKQWYDKSLTIWNDLQQHKNLGTEYVNNPKEVAQQLSKCNRALAQARD
jgi:eukaryotic-like serine/threonine-protein kinase